MRPIQAFVGALAAAVVWACGTATEPGRSSSCYYPGDTIGYAPLVQLKDSLILECFFVTEPDTAKVRCYTHIVPKFGTKDCVVGEKWKG